VGRSGCQALPIPTVLQTLDDRYLLSGFHRTEPLAGFVSSERLST
jgi:hypothetical protein